MLSKTKTDRSIKKDVVSRFTATVVAFVLALGFLVSGMQGDILMASAQTTSSPEILKSIGEPLASDLPGLREQEEKILVRKRELDKIEQHYDNDLDKLTSDAWEEEYGIGSVIAKLEENRKQEVKLTRQVEEYANEIVDMWDIDCLSMDLPVACEAERDKQQALADEKIAANDQKFTDLWSQQKELEQKYEAIKRKLKGEMISCSMQKNDQNTDVIGGLCRFIEIQLFRANDFDMTLAEWEMEKEVREELENGGNFSEINVLKGEVNEILKEIENLEERRGAYKKALTSCESMDSNNCDQYYQDWYESEDTLDTYYQALEAYIQQINDLISEINIDIINAKLDEKEKMKGLNKELAEAEYALAEARGN